MGNNTRYELETHIDSVKSVQEVLKDKQGSFEGLHYAFDNDGDSIESVKWYNHEEDMRELSEEFPNVIFILKGNEDEQEYSWIKYFKNGKMQYAPAKIKYDSYDENKLR